MSVYIERGQGIIGPHQFIKSTNKGNYGCHWFEEWNVRGSWEGALTERWIVKGRGRKREINTIRIVVGMRKGGSALSGGKAMDKGCGPREEGVSTYKIIKTG